MVAHAALAVIAALVITGGAGAAAVANGMLHTGGVGTFNLGTLNAGETGNVTVTTSIDLNSSGVYHFNMEKEDHIGNTFSTFSVSVAVNGTTYNLSNGEGNDSGVNLTAGNHTFTIALHYVVRNHVVSSNETNVPFLFLHKSDGFGDHNQTSELNETEINDSAVIVHSADSNITHENGPMKFALAYITFNVNGTVGQQGEDHSGSDNMLARAFA